MNEQKKAIDMTKEELKQWLKTLSASDTVNAPVFDTDPYLKHAITPKDSSCVQFDAVVVDSSPQRSMRYAPGKRCICRRSNA